MNKETIEAIVAGVFMGAAGGYILAEKLVSAKYEKLIEKEVEAARDMYKRRYKEDEYATPGDAVEALVKYSEEDQEQVINLLQGYGAEELTQKLREQQRFNGESEESEGPVLLEGEPIVRNVFEENSGVVDEGDRDPSKPYVISIGEFSEANDYDKISLTYYKGDDTLTDDQEGIVDDIEGVIGVDALGKFGHGSGDKNIVFVRNEVKDADYEVLCDERKYTEVVLGVSDLEDEQSPRVRKMRQDD